MNWSMAGAALVLTVWCGGFTALLFGSVWYAMEKRWRTFALCLTGIAVLVVLLAGLWPGDDGVHEWNGGSGPDTVCTYEVRYVKASPYTVTVCRDAEAQR